MLIGIEGRPVTGAPFLCAFVMNETPDSGQPLRPRKMAGVAFPPAKYGLILAVGIVMVMCALLVFEVI